jgi:hypothetical protein
MTRALAFSLIVILMTGSSVCAAKGNGAPSPAAQMQSARSGGGSGGGGGGRRPYADPRKAPPLDPKRKVSEQDCSRPVDLNAGNLKCK